jgi:hypothetical protein
MAGTGSPQYQPLRSKGVLPFRGSFVLLNHSFIDSVEGDSHVTLVTVVSGVSLTY